MALLQKTREKAGMAVSIIIAIALLSFIVDPSTLETAFQAMSKKNNVGEINGTSISYTDFSQDIEKFTTINEMMTGSSAKTEQQQDQIRNAAWQSLIEKHLFIKNANNAGIKVGTEEMKDLLSGEMYSPIIRQNPAFCDENGQFSKDAVQNLINSIASDQTGRMKLYWDYVQTSVNNQQYYAKYNSLFTSSNIENPLMLKRSLADNNNATNVDFVLVLPSFMHDSTIVVTDAEIQKYYNDHKKLFKQTASRDMEYVVFEVKPSDTDIQATSDAVAAVYDEFATTENMKSFLARNSEKAYSEYWYKDGELSSINQEINDFAAANTDGASAVVKDNSNVFYAARIMASAQIPDSAFVKHILLQGVDAKSKADSLVAVLSSKGASFSEVAVANSLDQHVGEDGEVGSIGWMTQTYMIPGFESVLTAQVGKPFVLTSQYGTHVVEVTAKTAPVAKKQVAILQKTSLASNETYNEYYSKANKFATLAAGSYENYKAAVDTTGIYSHPMQNVPESNSVYGTIDHAKEVTRWIYDNKVGKVSDIIIVDNNYFFVAALTGIHKDGIADIKEVSSQIRQILYSQKVGEKAAADMAEKISGMNDLSTIAEAYNTSVSTNVDVRFASMAGQGLDAKFIGSASVAPEGQICGPVAGNIGTYVYKVNSREAGAFYTEDDAKKNAAQMMSYASQMILPVMMDEAGVKDNRARFF